ncbi:MAG: hypothetical protein EAZ42_11580 [Verrucomicrobia bacterium]|nr:MAG: hypothetical protein EAZ42_11580 [Verrucomicrobiota bacterium]
MNRWPMIIALLSLLFVGIFVGVRAQDQPPTPRKKVVLIAGKASHGPGDHEHRAGCLLFQKHLNQSGLPIDAVVVTEGWPEDESVFDGAAAVIIYADGGEGHPAMAHLPKLKAMAAAGIGIGCIHYAVEMPPGEGGETLLGAIGGYFEINYSVNPFWDASFKMPEHEITHGIGDFMINDEWYYHMRFVDGEIGVTPILTDLPPAESLSRPDGRHSGNPQVRAAVLERREKQHMMWAFERAPQAGGGRGFGFTGGHRHLNWQHDDFRRVVLNAIVWVAGVEVPKEGIISPTPSDADMAENLDDKSAR